MRMDKTNALKDDLKKVIETVIQAYYCEADKNAAYPYAVFDFRLLSSDSFDNYILEIEGWDMYKSYSRIDSLFDRLENVLNGFKELNDERILKIYKSNRAHQKDENRDIKHVRLVCSMQVIERS